MRPILPWILLLRSIRPKLMDLLRHAVIDGEIPYWRCEADEAWESGQAFDDSLDLLVLIFNLAISLEIIRRIMPIQGQ